MPKLSIAVLLLLLFQSALPTHAATPSQIDRLLAASGLVDIIAEIPATIEASTGQYPSVPLERIQRALQATQSLGGTDLIKREMSAAMTQLSDADAASLLNWVESSAGQQVAAAEVSASSTPAIQYMLQNAPQLLENTELVGFAKDHIAAFGLDEMMVDLQMRIAALLLDAAKASDSQACYEPCLAQLEAAAPMMRAQMEHMMILSAVYAYQNLDPSVLQQYRTHLQSPLAQRFHRIEAEGFVKGFEVYTQLYAAQLFSVLQST